MEQCSSKTAPKQPAPDARPVQSSGHPLPLVVCCWSFLRSRHRSSILVCLVRLPKAGPARTNSPLLGDPLPALCSQGEPGSNHHLQSQGHCDHGLSILQRRTVLLPWKDMRTLATGHNLILPAFLTFPFVPSFLKYTEKSWELKSRVFSLRLVSRSGRMCQRREIQRYPKKSVKMLILGSHGLNQWGYGDCPWTDYLPHPKHRTFQKEHYLLSFCIQPRSSKTCEDYRAHSTKDSPYPWMLSQIPDFTSVCFIDVI